MTDDTRRQRWEAEVEGDPDAERYNEDDRQDAPCLAHLALNRTFPDFHKLKQPHRILLVKDLVGMMKNERLTASKAAETLANRVSPAPLVNYADTLSAGEVTR
jgi:hypothetical protein